MMYLELNDNKIGYTADCNTTPYGYIINASKNGKTELRVPKKFLELLLYESAPRELAGTRLYDGVTIHNVKLILEN